MVSPRIACGFHSVMIKLIASATSLNSRMKERLIIISRLIHLTMRQNLHEQIHDVGTDDNIRV